MCEGVEFIRMVNWREVLILLGLCGIRIGRKFFGGRCGGNVGECIDLYDLDRLYLGIVWRDWLLWDDILVIPTYNPSVNKTLFMIYRTFYRKLLDKF